jgi:hypothetical protein
MQRRVLAPEKAKYARVRVLLNYMQSQDRSGMAAAYNFYLGSVLPGTIPKV